MIPEGEVRYEEVWIRDSEFKFTEFLYIIGDTRYPTFCNSFTVFFTEGRFACKYIEIGHIIRDLLI